MTSIKNVIVCADGLQVARSFIRNKHAVPKAGVRCVEAFRRERN